METKARSGLPSADNAAPPRFAAIFAGRDRQILQG